jgi:hypothetical protein
VYEVGVALQVHQNAPIFSADPQEAPARFPWLRQALRSVQLAAKTCKAPPLRGRHGQVAIKDSLTS